MVAPCEAMQPEMTCQLGSGFDIQIIIGFGVPFRKNEWPQSAINRIQI
jgi:hypothetical protein